MTLGQIIVFSTCLTVNFLLALCSCFETKILSDTAGDVTELRAKVSMLENRIEMIEELIYQPVVKEIVKCEEITNGNLQN